MQLSNNFRYALRNLRKSPVFAVIAILSLALGIGANTAIFSIIYQVLLEPLRVHEPARLVLLSQQGFHYGLAFGTNVVSHPFYEDLSRHNQVFSEMFCQYGEHASVAYEQRTERVKAEFVSGSYFPAVALSAQQGRLINSQDDLPPTGQPVVVLSYAYWQSRFGANADITGKTIRVNAHPVTVIGIAAPGFDGLEPQQPAQIFLPLHLKLLFTPIWTGFTDRNLQWIHALGRLRPGVTAAQAQASIAPFFHASIVSDLQLPAFRTATPEVRAKVLQNQLFLLSGARGIAATRDPSRVPLFALLAITGFVLLIACANVAGLLITRAASRQKEIAVRLAIGASRAGIIQQLLTESLVLFLAGGVVGVAVSKLIGIFLLQLLPADSKFQAISTNPDARVLLFTLAISLLTGLVFGLIPALQSTRVNVAPTLKVETGGVVSGNAVQVRARKTLVALQVSLALLLLIGAGLFIRSLRNLRNLGPGFPTGNLAEFTVDPSLNSYTGAQSKQFAKRLSQEIASIPGVRSTTFAYARILEDLAWNSGVTVEGYRNRPERPPVIWMNAIGPRYFETLGVPLLAGREFTDDDDKVVQHGVAAGNIAPTVVMVNEGFARQFFGSAQNALGRHAGQGSDPSTKIDMEIIGVARDIKYENLRNAAPPQMFTPFLSYRNPLDVTVYVRTVIPPEQLFSAIRAKVQALDSNLPIYSFRTFDAQVSNSLLNERMLAVLAGAFGFLATLLSVIGLYGVMAFAVSRRTREIGIRIALGAFPTNVIWMVLSEVLSLLLVGLFAGFIAALFLTRFVRTQLYGVAAFDPMVLFVAALLLSLAALAAGLIPAARASRVDPIRALRHE